MKFIKPLLLESKQIGNLYHFTSFYNCIQILESCKLRAHESIDDEYFLINYKYSISFTRNPLLYKTLSDKQKYDGSIRFDVRLKFSGDILSNNYKIQPYDDNSNRSQQLLDKGFDMGDEMEEKLYTNNRFVDINKSFLNEVLVLYKNKERYETDLNDENSRFNIIKNICLENNYSFKVLIY